MLRARFREAAILVAGVAVGCSGSPAAPTSTRTPTPPRDSISLSSISPTAGTVLHAGQMVRFTAVVDYTLASAESGQVVIVIQDEKDHSLAPSGVPQPSVSVTRGTGTATLSDSVTVPASGVASVRVFFPLVPGGAATTDVVVSVSYPVQ